MLNYLNNDKKGVSPYSKPHRKKAFRLISKKYNKVFHPVIFAA